MEPANVADRIRQYYRDRSGEFQAACRKAIVPHNPTRGTHRENAVTALLREIVPKRFAVDSGMVCGRSGWSLQADSVIWDHTNYPSIPQADGHLVFAEAARIVVEAKSCWSADEFKDVRDKCRAVHALESKQRSGLHARVASLEARADYVSTAIDALKYGREPKTPQSFGASPLSTAATAAVFVTGGQTFTPTNVEPDVIDDITDGFPTVAWFASTGRVIHVRRRARPFTGVGRVDFIDAGDDGLLALASVILAMLAERSGHVEDPLYLEHYCRPVLDGLPTTVAYYFPSTPKNPKPEWSLRDRKDVPGG